MFIKQHDIFFQLLYNIIFRLPTALCSVYIAKQVIIHRYFYVVHLVQLQVLYL